MPWPIEQTQIGRIAVPPGGAPVFCTTIDYDGKLSDALTQLIRDRFGRETTLSTCNQVHGVNLAHAPCPEAECDALWTDRRGVALGIKIADCLPIALRDPARDVVANIHSGWRGAEQQIVARTLDALESSSSFDAAGAFAYLGPSIRVCCFEVGEEVAAQFDERYVDRTHAKPHIDLIAMTTAILRERGLAPENISDSGLCTRCEGSIFHSYRRGARGARNLMIATS